MRRGGRVEPHYALHFIWVMIEIVPWVGLRETKISDAWKNVLWF